MIAVGERWNEVAVHVRRARKAVQQYDDRCTPLSRLAVEYFHSVNARGSMIGDGGHCPSPWGCRPPSASNPRSTGSPWTCCHLEPTTKAPCKRTIERDGAPVARALETGLV